MSLPYLNEIITGDARELSAAIPDGSVDLIFTEPIRIAKQFEGYRKLGKTHQNVLCFYKGDPKRIKDFGPVEMGDPMVTSEGAADV